MQRQMRLIQFGSAMALALILGATLGHLPLFAETALGHARLHASDIAQFLGYGGALVMLWMLCRELAIPQHEDNPKLAFVSHLVMPLATLIVVSLGYRVLLFVAGPFLGPAGRRVYDWIFVLGMIATAIWLTVAWFQHSVSLNTVLQPRDRTDASPPASSHGACHACGATMRAGTKYCSACGHRLHVTQRRPKAI